MDITLPFSDTKVVGEPDFLIFVGDLAFLPVTFLKSESLTRMRFDVNYSLICF